MSAFSRARSALLRGALRAGREAVRAGSRAVRAAQAAIDAGERAQGLTPEPWVAPPSPPSGRSSWQEQEEDIAEAAEALEAAGPAITARAIDLGWFDEPVRPPPPPSVIPPLGPGGPPGSWEKHSLTGAPLRSGRMEGESMGHVQAANSFIDKWIRGNRSNIQIVEPDLKVRLASGQEVQVPEAVVSAVRAQDGSQDPLVDWLELEYSLAELASIEMWADDIWGPPDWAIATEEA